MSKKIGDLIEAIKEEAERDAMDEIAKGLVTKASGLWLALKDRCGKPEAALAVVALLHEAMADGAIGAFQFEREGDGEDDATVTLYSSLIDEGCIEIRPVRNATVFVEAK